MTRRIESRTSNTAEFTCLARGLSNLEKREQYKSDDYVSLVIMNDIIRPLLHFDVFKRMFMGKYPAGMYEYVIARTKTVDAEFKRALEDGIKQVLIFGAGFDSRGIRLGRGVEQLRVFELDAPLTQAAKVERYRQKKVGIPDNLIFVPIDFDRESLSERLFQAGVEKGFPSLFILEGLTMYLQPESVDDTFRVIEEFSGTESRIVFDHIYASVIRQENLYEGEKTLYQNVAKAGESFCFGIERGHADEFLRNYGFTPELVLDAEKLEDMYFRTTNGELAGCVNKTHCIVMARKSNDIFKG